MSEEEIDAWKHISEELDRIWPFKRVMVPKHLLDRYNKEFYADSGVKMAEYAITVKKEVEVTDDMIWEAMTFMKKIDWDAETNPPSTGLEKRTLV